MGVRKRLGFAIALAALLASVTVPALAAVTPPVGAHPDPVGDTIDPIATQNEATKLERDGFAGADITSWKINFDPTANNGNISGTGPGGKIPNTPVAIPNDPGRMIATVTVKGNIPKPCNTVGCASAQGLDPNNLPPGFVGASYRFVFNSPTMESAQITGKACGTYTDPHTGHKPHQSLLYAQCTNALFGPFHKDDGWKWTVAYNWRIGVAGDVEGVIEWGTFDPANNLFTFRNVEETMPCDTTTTGYDQGTPPGGGCAWHVKITQTGGGDTIEFGMPYHPNSAVDDGDDNAVAVDDIRTFRLINAGQTVDDVIMTSWVVQEAGLPVPVCDPTDDTCDPFRDENDSFGECHPAPIGQKDPPGAVACYQAKATASSNDVVNYTNATAAEAREYATTQRITTNDGLFDCTPRGQRGACIQEIGGFLFIVDWDCGECGDSKDGFYLGITPSGFTGVSGYTLGGTAYINGPSCRYGGSEIVGRIPSGVFVTKDATRVSGFTTVILSYGVNVPKNNLWPGDAGWTAADGNRPGWENRFVNSAGAQPSTVQAANAAPNTTIPNLVTTDGKCGAFHNANAQQFTFGVDVVA